MTIGDATTEAEARRVAPGAVYALSAAVLFLPTHLPFACWPSCRKRSDSWQLSLRSRREAVPQGKAVSFRTSVLRSLSLLRTAMRLQTALGLLGPCLGVQKSTYIICFEPCRFMGNTIDKSQQSKICTSCQHKILPHAVMRPLAQSTTVAVCCVATDLTHVAGRLIRCWCSTVWKCGAGLLTVSTNEVVLFTKQHPMRLVIRRMV
eukprot:5740050-Pleurochrysis_carterae.AAC.5